MKGIGKMNLEINGVEMERITIGELRRRLVGIPNSVFALVIVKYLDNNDHHTGNYHVGFKKKEQEKNPEIKLQGE